MLTLAMERNHWTMSSYQEVRGREKTENDEAAAERAVLQGEYSRVLRRGGDFNPAGHAERVGVMAPSGDHR